MSYLAGSQFATFIQSYNRVLVIIFSLIGFLKSNSYRYSSNINLIQIISFLILSIPSIIFGFIIFGDSSFKPLAYGIASIGAFIVPPNKNLVNNLFKLFIIFLFLKLLFFEWRPLRSSWDYTYGDKSSIFLSQDYTAHF